MIQNPYFDEFKSLHGVDDTNYHQINSIFWRGKLDVGRMVSLFTARHDLVDKYSFAVPDQTAIEIIGQYGPILEIGAGRGYWAWLLQQLGVDVVASDLDPPPNSFHTKSDHTFTTIVQGDGPLMVPKHPWRSLMFCWPYMDSMAANCLKASIQPYVIYIGEGGGGCTGDNEFHAILDREFEMIRDYPIPHFQGIHDRLEIYRRRTHESE